jgi:predicted acylesterase/phospholipase RssA
LIDGGVVNNTPISHAVALGAERIYVLPTQDHSRRRAHVPKSALDAAVYGVTRLVGSRLHSDVARYSRDAQLVVLPAANATNVQPTSFDHSSRLIAEALAATRALLKSRGVGQTLRLVESDERVGAPPSPELQPVASDHRRERRSWRDADEMHDQMEVR